MKHLLRITTSGLVLILLIGIQGFAQTKKKRPVYHSVDANQVMRVRLNDELNSEKARIGDTFTSTLVEPVYSKNGVLIAPQGHEVKVKSGTEFGVILNRPFSLPKYSAG